MTVIENHADMLSVARGWALELSARAVEAERLRTMPPDLAVAAKQAGLFRLALPCSLGGFELDPATIVTVIEELSRADGSAGWTVLIGNSTVFFAWLDPSVAAGLLAGNANVASTSVFAPKGRAAPDGRGGLVIDGRWPFNSGCPHAEWFQTGVMVIDGDRPRLRPDGRPDWRLAFFARDGAEILDTWDAAGLRGTGSHDIEVRGLRVPEEQTAAPIFDRATHDGPLWKFPFFVVLATFMSGFPLGVGRRALDELAALAPTKSRGASNGTVAENPHAQFEYGRAEAGLQAARLLVFDALGDAWDSAQRGDPTSPRQHARVQLAMQNAKHAALTAVDTAFSLAGAGAVYTDHPLQRCFRDLHTAGHRFGIATQAKR